MSGVGLPRGWCSREAGTGVQGMGDERANIFRAFAVFWIERFALESSLAVGDAEDHRGMPNIVDDDGTRRPQKSAGNDLDVSELRAPHERGGHVVGFEQPNHRA